MRERDRRARGVEPMQVPYLAAVILEGVVTGRPARRLELDDTRPGMEPHGDLDPGIVSARLDRIANLGVREGGDKQDGGEREATEGPQREPAGANAPASQFDQ